MSHPLVNTFFVNEEPRTIIIAREFAAGLPLVWDAFTKSELLDKWWAPKPWKARTHTMDFREGGYWHYALLGPEGEEHWALATYKSIQHQKKATGLDSFADADGRGIPELPQSAWELNFTEGGSVTLVETTITFGDLAELEATMSVGFKERLMQALEGLDTLLQTLQKEIKK